MNPLVSLFGSYQSNKPQGKIPISDFLLTDTYKEQVEEIRCCTVKARRRELKSKLPAITPSGVFYGRRDSALIIPSYLLCVDIDGDDNPYVQDWEDVKDALSDLCCLYYAGLSVGGNGLFLIFRVSDYRQYREHYKALSEELFRYGFKVDASCCNVSRLRGVSYDPNPFYNPDADEYTGIQNAGKPVKSDTSVKVPDNPDLTTYRVGKLVQRIVVTGTDITRDYRDWFAVGCSLASEFGEAGRGWFHVISRQYDRYNYRECDRQYDNCMKCSQFSIGTFFGLCKRYGLTLK